MQYNTNTYNHNSNSENNNTFNLTFIGHNINDLESDHSKFNLLTKYCLNKRANIIRICETNRNKYTENFETNKT